MVNADTGKLKGILNKDFIVWFIIKNLHMASKCTKMSLIIKELR